MYQYILDLRNQLEEIFQLIQQSLYGAYSSQKHFCKQKTNDHHFQVGQSQFCCPETIINSPKSLKGPFEIQEVLNRVDCKVNVNRKNKIYHANVLKYFRREEDIMGAVIKTKMDIAGMAIMDAYQKKSQKMRIYSN